MTRARGWGRKLAKIGKRKNKYNARKVQLDGYTFDSDKEAKRYLLLKQRQRAGEIWGLTVHPKYDLIVNGMKVGWVTLDASYYEGVALVAEDTKGFAARDWPLRSRLFMALYPDIELRVNGLPAKKPKPPKVSRPKKARPSTPKQEQAA